MWGKFRLGNVMVLLFHGQGQEDMLESWVNGGGWNLFNKSMKPMKMKNR